MKFINARKGSPCEICGKQDWCSRSTDGDFIICRRILRDGGELKIDSSGGEYYLYKKQRRSYDTRYDSSKK